MKKENKEVAEVLVKEDKEVVVAASTEQFDDGLGELDSSDLIIPRLIVAQANSPVPDEVKGMLFCEVTGDAFHKMNLVIVKLTRSRTMFPEKYAKGNLPLCRSWDFHTPANDIEDAEPMCDTCELLPGDKRKHKCEYANWSAKTPPRCNEIWNLLVIDTQSYLPMWFSLKSTALKPARKIISALKMRGHAKRIPSWGFSFNVEVETRTGDSGDSYIPTFSGLAELNESDRANMDIIREQLIGEDVKNAPIDQEAPPTSDDDTGDF